MSIKIPSQLGVMVILALALCIAGQVGVPRSYAAPSDATAYSVTVSTNYGETDETFYANDGEVFADAGFIASVTRFDVSMDGNKMILKQAVRIVTIDPDAQTLSETNDGGDTSDTFSMKVLSINGSLFVPAYSMLNYLGAMVSFDMDTLNVDIDMPLETFWEAFSFAFEGKLAVSQLDHSDTRLFLDNVVDFVNPGGKGIFDLVSGGYRDDVIYAAMDADTLSYDSVQAAAAARTEAINTSIEQIKNTKDVVSSGFDFAFLADDARLSHIALLDDKLDRMASYVSYFDNAGFRSKVENIADNAGTAIDAALLGYDVMNTVYERTNADASAVQALRSTFSDSTYQTAGKPSLNSDDLHHISHVLTTLSSPDATAVITSLEKGGDFLVTKTGDEVIKALAGGSGAIAYELGGVVANVIAVSPVGKYTPFAEIPKADASRTAIIAADYFNQIWEVWNGLGDQMISEKIHVQETLNAFYYAYLLLLRFSLVWDEAGMKYNDYVAGGDAHKAWFADRADAVAKAIYDTELVSVNAIPRLGDLDADAGVFDEQFLANLKPAPIGMDLVAINTGDTSSIAGVWMTQSGSTLTITGQYLPDIYPYTPGPTSGSFGNWGKGIFSGGVLVVTYNNYSGAGDGGLIFAPSGARLPDDFISPSFSTHDTYNVGYDNSDQTRERIFFASGAGPWVGNPAKEAYYRT